MIIAIPDLISNSYFPAAAAVELGFFKEEGLDVELELIFPVDRTYEKLRDGEIDFVGGSAHSAPHAFPEWEGVKLLASQAQGMYWFLILRADLNAKQGDLSSLQGLKIGAAPLVDLGLQRLLIEAGLDPEENEIKIAPVPGAFSGNNLNFGVTAAKALEEGTIDGFWANGMGAEVAIRRGVGTKVIDARRGDGPDTAFNFTMPSMAATDKLINDTPEVAAAAVRALVKTQQALKADVSQATKVGEKLFPAEEAAIIADLIERDLPFYDASISPEFVSGMTQFQRDVGLIEGTPSYEEVVATQFKEFWSA